ncbi:hypothetical protein E2C01_016093 [Portunus trituberculatus]|uniref:Uncharacterized protein n=1 Tax=Portunus trituberculatus TaxID=210409 RepID=A0A5B7DQ60_PORTR|nr:hypothetical protein [Portunus trituberculatus]
MRKKDSGHQAVPSCKHSAAISCHIHHRCARYRVQADVQEVYVLHATAHAVHPQRDQLAATRPNLRVLPAATQRGRHV